MIIRLPLQTDIDTNTLSDVNDPNPPKRTLTQDVDQLMVYMVYMQNGFVLVSFGLGDFVAITKNLVVFNLWYDSPAVKLQKPGIGWSDVESIVHALTGSTIFFPPDKFYPSIVGALDGSLRSGEVPDIDSFYKKHTMIVFPEITEPDSETGWVIQAEVDPFLWEGREPFEEGCDFIEISTLPDAETYVGNPDDLIAKDKKILIDRDMGCGSHILGSQDIQDFYLYVDTRFVMFRLWRMDLPVVTHIDPSQPMTVEDIEKTVKRLSGCTIEWEDTIREVVEDKLQGEI